ncbi:beta-glucosidase BglX [Gaoshiqia sediminis]|uniref:Periplasmic beta-glucosidase n=1 Tax=Gaoshiqia sediminis TaxID=2986998 RepID=A0AA41Y9I1_9BACT|nr:beta-glucosidase BglX [Gaoshiqia sediminis]MCW0483742.1 beta-glucosidase BglX [Gaoshiqia sediminis]
MRTMLLIGAIALFLVSCGQKPKETEMDRYINNLMAEMTLQEKIGQMNLITPGGGIPTGAAVSSDVEAKIKAGKVGGVFGVSGPEKVRQAQDLAVKESRLGIPLLFGSDVIHGYKTTFPIPLGLSCSWDMELIEKTARIAAVEATADGIFWNFSPMVDIARDPRWGRIAEGAGEDPYLGSEIAKAMVIGYQGDDLTAPNTMMATVKHFALYGASEAGRDYHTTDMSRLRMFNEYLPPYKAAIDAEVGCVMSSFNDVDGIPASGNKWLLTDLLRNQWGFDGFVVSDYTSVNEMIDHGLGDLQTVSALALKAGLDMDMVGEGFLTTLEKSLEEGKVSEADINTACRRILEAKYKLGLFDDPYRYIDENRAKTEILSLAHRELARQAAAQSFVLLKNEKQVLPLKKAGTIALVGPLADSKNNMLGTWAPTGDPQLSVPVLEGMQNVAGTDVKLLYAKGANISDDPEFARKVNVFGPRIEIDERSPEDMLKEAVVIAQKADVVVAVIGEATEMSGESSSRSDITIPEPQKKLLRALAKTGKPLVLVLMSGRPLALEEENQLADAILLTWHPGVEAGNAIADVLFGAYNPSGKLTATFPRNVGQIPIYYNHKNTGRPNPGDEFQKFRSNYLDVPNSPLYPFGYGLSYTRFEYKDLTVSKETITLDESLEVTVDVTNTGNYDGAEVVQLYVRDVVGSVSRPLKELKAFQKVFIPKGETKRVSFKLSVADLSFYRNDLSFGAEPGQFMVFVGSNSDTEDFEEFTLK